MAAPSQKVPINYIHCMLIRLFVFLATQCYLTSCDSLLELTLIYWWGCLLKALTHRLVQDNRSFFEKVLLIIFLQEM